MDLGAAKTRFLGRRRLSAGALLAGALAPVILFPGLVHAEDATIKIDNFTFAPARLAVKAGTTVT